MTRQIQLALATFRPRGPIPGQTILDPSVTRTRVRPGDLDIYLHMNNAVYLNLMDSGRSNLIADCGGSKPLAERGWYPVVAASTVTYKRSLTLFQPVEVTSRVLGWDPRIVYLEQVVTSRGQLSARGLVAGRFLAKDGSRIPAPDVAALLGGHVTSPTLPDDVAAWARAVDVAHRD
ncbi:Acyl-CoA thioesterase FadM [Sanguibacter gelidistatuariae]|uniref:Acyl-CoA thioesterase FadM n=1 Tax=Sanguibacter gelidistatuariae TaxID=1814289 RepID=A0A1G6RAF3_9MICO|nr:acyl-CoA thioesterase [Sanguibacter gelidistatuariae]SDD01284.1 Acyl-CoA thioesterase FadM [Sanguibacter gelidistatuariae]